MSEEQPLNELYERYERGLLTKSELECALFTFIRDQPWRYKLSGWMREDLDDFIADLYPLIGKAIDSYKKQGSCFDAYLYAVIRWTAIGSRFRSVEETAMERAYWRERQAEQTCEHEAGYEAKDPSDQPAMATKRPRQILVLTLKCCLLVSDDLCDRIAPHAGMSAEELKQSVNGLRTKIAWRLQRKRDIQDRAAAQYYRSIVLQAKAATVPEQSQRRMKYERSAAFARKRLERLRDQASRMPIEATNREVAEALNVPKGTIDASLHFLKKRLGPLHCTGAEQL